MLTTNSIILCAQPYYSGDGQDSYAYNTFFKNKVDGIFVEIGANDGIFFSNTCFFEKTLGWKGICVEPIPSIFDKLKKNRQCICIQGCISNSEGTALFLQFNVSLVSGLVEKFDPRHLERWGHVPHQVITVPCFLPKTIFDTYSIKHIDYLSIDTEGGEYDILKAIDFKSVYIDVINVEIRWEDDTRIHEFLTHNGYAFITRIRSDNIYKHL